MDLVEKLANESGTHKKNAKEKYEGARVTDGSYCLLTSTICIVKRVGFAKQPCHLWWRDLTQPFDLAEGAVRAMKKRKKEVKILNK